MAAKKKMPKMPYGSSKREPMMDRKEMASMMPKGKKGKGKK